MKRHFGCWQKYLAKHSIRTGSQYYSTIAFYASILLSLFYFIDAMPVMAVQLPFTQSQVINTPSNILLSTVPQLIARNDIVGTSTLGEPQSKSSGAIDPNLCTTRGYSSGDFYFLGCFTANNTLGIGNDKKNSAELGCVADVELTSTSVTGSASNAPNNGNSNWRMCDNSSEVLYFATDPITKQQVNCDSYTVLPRNAGIIRGCYGMRSAVTLPPSTSNRPPSGLQCMSNGRILGCTGGLQKVLTMKPILGVLPGINGNGTNGQNENERTSNTTNSSNGQNTDDSSYGDSQKLSSAVWTGIIAGIALGGVGIIGIVTLLVRRYMLKKRAQQDTMRQIGPLEI
ncbi:hypothetical protein BDF19DRAFT_429133, partial [Syncephalis fuscata]